MRALLAAAVAAIALTAVPSAPAAGAAPLAADPAAPAAPRPDVDLGHDHRGAVVASDPELVSARGAGVSWPRGEIRYYETIPAKWQWGLDRAVQQWNTSGARIRFVKVATKGRAQVTIGYGDTHGSDGLGGWTARGNKIFKGFVRIHPKYKQVDEKDDDQRVWMGRLIAHELGHVLGYDHTPGQCSLMTPIFYFGTCGPLSEGKPGYYQCRWIDSALLKAHIRKYGGAARRPAEHCLTYPLPRQLSGVAFGGGGDVGGSGGSAVTISWAPISRTRPLEHVRIAKWAASDSCATEPEYVWHDFRVATSRTSWVDPTAGTGLACYRVQAANHSGIGPRGFGQAMQQFAPTPAPPAMTAPTWRPADEQWRTRWTAPVGQYLAVMEAGPGAPCPTTYVASQAYELYGDDQGLWYLDVETADQCAAFFAVNEAEKVSAPVTFQLSVPAPTSKPVLTGPPVYEGGNAWMVKATVADGATVDFAVVGGPCASAVTPPPDEFYAGYRNYDAPDLYTVYAYGGGVSCMLAAVVDPFGRSGPVAKLEWTVTAD